MAERERRDPKRDPRDEHEARAHVSLEGDRIAHLAIQAKRWEGSVPPTPEAYARAIALWRQLPGAIITTPTDLGHAADLPSPSSEAASDTLDPA